MIDLLAIIWLALALLSVVLVCALILGMAFVFYPAIITFVREEVAR